MKKEIPLSEPLLRGNERRYIKECLDANWVSYGGSFVRRFEDAVAEYTGAKHAVAIVNGTAALHISLLACGVSPGDEVIIPTLTFVATANVVKYCRAEPVFMDCDSATLCVDVGKLIDFIRKETIRGRDGFTYNRLTKKRIKAVVPVHIFGHPADMDPLINICKDENIDVIEDATESLGSEYNGRKTGRFGKIGCFSFNGNKIITTGGGGMIVTDDKKIADKIRHLATQAKRGLIEYDHDDIGYNYRLSNIQAAIGCAQMEKLDKYINIKRRNAYLYRNLLSGIKGVEFLWESPQVKNNFWFYTISVLKNDKKLLVKYMLSKGIQVRPIWKLLHSLPMYKSCQAYRIELAKKVYETCINIPCSVGLKRNEIKSVVNAIKDRIGT